MSNCTNGLILPLWFLDEAKWNQGLRAVLYLLGLLYSFLGVAIAADVFMCAIERITSQKRKVRISTSEAMANASEDQGSDLVLYKEVEIWNPTVANLTLMALGSSAPEILLSCIEIVGNGFRAGELGPGTIVGSAAFNLLVITAICIMSIPSGETRRVQEILVFIVTASFSIFAYIWLLIILLGTSPNEVEVWEGFMTLFFFAVLVVIAYLADRKFCMKKKDEDRVGKEAGIPLKDATENYMLGRTEEDQRFARWRDVEREVALSYPNLSTEEQARMVAWRIAQEAPHDRLYWRIRAARWMSRGARSEEYWDRSNKALIPTRSMDTISTLPGAPTKRVIEFATRIYGITKGDKHIRIRIIRRGRPSKKLLFHYQTVDGSAKRNVHYLPKAETLVFEPGESEKTVNVELVEGAEWSVRDTFYIRLATDDEKTDLGQCTPAEVQFFEPAAGSSIEFVKNHAHVRESAGFVRLRVIRRGSFNTKCSVEWETADITAETGKDYEGGTGELIFEPGDVQKYIDISIIDDMYEEYAETFSLSLLKASPGNTVGAVNRCIVTISCDDGASKYFRQMDTLVPNLLDYLKPGGKSWKEQLLRATSVNAGDIENATLGDILGHILAFPWKVIFALVPPPSLLGGWLCFVVSLVLIGVLTAIIGDLAGIFGCIVGLKASVTAITFVALGTSLPDTFASRLAAVNEATADNSIGNITGSNSVNVFLGLGLPWFIASIYWASKGKPFEVSAGSLSFSVTVYTIASVLAISLLFCRRFLDFFGKAELGGPFLGKVLSAVFLVFLWFMYILLSSLQAYGHIPSF